MYPLADRSKEFFGQKPRVTLLHPSAGIDERFSQRSVSLAVFVAFDSSHP